MPCGFVVPFSSLAKRYALLIPSKTGTWFMYKTKLKSAEEIEQSLKVFRRVALFSCAACANLCDVGVIRGMEFMQGLLEGLGKEVVTAKIVLGCCAEAIMRQAWRIHLEPVSRLDALVVISCASGMKSAFLCNFDAPVIAACDSVGSAAVSLINETVDELTARSLCTSCGRCAISYTGGICPMNERLVKSRGQSLT